MFCPRCGHGDYTPGYFCTNCGYHQSQPIQTSNTPPAAPQPGANPPSPHVSSPTPVQNPMLQPIQQPVQNHQPVSQPVQQRVSNPTSADVYRSASQPAQQPVQPYQPAPQQTPQPMEPAVRGKGKKQKPVKVKRKRSAKVFFKKLLIFILVNAFLVFLWFAVGNYITLTIHSSEVIETINSGSLELSGVVNDDFDKLPTYVQNRLQRPQQKNGPIVDRMLPYIRIERVKVNGFFGGSSVEYKVAVPDLEEWILSLKDSGINNQEDFLAEMEHYIRQAPRAPRSVTIHYYSDGWFSWKGNYNTPEFLDAITGGMNTAYTKLYEEAMDELEEMLQ